MRDPLVSIIIPCWNAEATVGEAIESALAQTYPNLEIIVIDDGSTDHSLAVIESFGDRIRYESGPNAGACAARNRGLALATGTLIQFLDADDVLHSNKLEEQVPLAVENPSELVYCDWETVSAGGSDRKLNALENAGIDSVVYVLTRPIQTSCPLHWKDALDNIGGFREHLPCAQERDLHIRLACSGVRFRHLPKILCTIRRRFGSLSENLLRVVDQHLDTALIGQLMLRDRGELTEERAIALAGFLARDARTYLKHREWVKAQRYLAAARQMHASGGLGVAYGSITRLLQAWIGPAPTEFVGALGRGFLQSFHPSSGRKRPN